MRVFAIDPGSEESAVVVLDAQTKKIVDSMHLTNDEVLAMIVDGGIKNRTDISIDSETDRIVIEKVESYGQGFGAELIQTIHWGGRFHQAWKDKHGDGVRFVTRKEVKSHLCGHTRARDTDIRFAIHDRFGGKEKAKGTKKEPGPLHWVTAHQYAALAVGYTWIETSLPEVSGKG